MAAQKPGVETSGSSIPTLPGLDQEMEEGYRSEAATPSLDPEWSSFEVEDLDVDLDSDTLKAP